jgi:hypothetical protein
VAEVKDHLIVDRAVELVPVSKLKTHPDNPRKGDVKAISESLANLDQYRPIVVQKSTGFILAGNHTYLAAKALKWSRIGVVYVDVDDVKAKKIIAADNRTSDLGGYDVKLLQKLLGSLPDLDGTAWTQPDLTKMVEDYAEIDRVGMTQGVVDGTQGLTGGHPSTGGLPIPEGNDDEPLEVDDPFAPADGEESTTEDIGDTEHKKLEDFEGEMENPLLELRDDVLFIPTSNKWDIPELKSGMLMDAIPDRLRTWAGKDATPVEDEADTWLYNYGADSANGLPWEKTLLSFYTHDRFFDNWWEYPSYYVARIIQAGVLGSITPNYTLYSQGPQAVNLFNTYRSRWMSRYFQEAGIKVIPDVNVAAEAHIELAMLGVPKNPPLLAFQFQSLGGLTEEEMVKLNLEVINQLQPGHLLIYGGPPAERIAAAIDWPGGHTFLQNRAAIRRGTVFDRWKQDDAKAVVSQVPDVDDYEQEFEDIANH